MFGGLRGALVLALLGALLPACVTAAPRAPTGRFARHLLATTVHLSTFEVRQDGTDRFEHCPPAGDIGQATLPPIPEWHPSAAPAPTDTAVDAPSDTVAAGGVPASASTLTWEAIKATSSGFRSCYHRGLLYDHEQDGHVSVVLRVDATGRVARAETWGACGLAPVAVACMREEAAHLWLPPPATGSATVIVPAVFTSAARRAPEQDDAYAAASYVAVESMRERLHGCLDAARAAGTDVTASAVMTVDVDEEGRGVHIAVDQWKGGHELLGCAAQVIREARYPLPPLAQGRIVVPIVFNPRTRTR